MGAAITYLLLDLEGVDTEPDILDDGKKGPPPIVSHTFTLSLGVSSSQTSINLSTIPIYPPSTRPVPTPYTRAPLKDTPH
eukprot:scaffold8788_cov108-Isochrysis_galbana.AAC.1